MVYFNCQCMYCGKEIYRRPCVIKKGNVFCSVSHQLKYDYENGIRDKAKITKKANEMVKKYGFPQRKGVKHSEERKRKIKESCKGINKGLNNGMFGKKPWNKLVSTSKWWEEKEFMCLRELCLERDKQCVVCGETEKDLYCDHIIPYRICKEHKLDNLQMLCGSCHSKKTSEDVKKYLSHVDCRSTLVFYPGEKK